MRIGHDYVKKYMLNHDFYYPPIAASTMCLLYVSASLSRHQLIQNDSHYSTNASLNYFIISFTLLYYLLSFQCIWTIEFFFRKWEKNCVPLIGSIISSYFDILKINLSDWHYDSSKCYTNRRVINKFQI